MIVGLSGETSRSAHIRLRNLLAGLVLVIGSGIAQAQTVSVGATPALGGPKGNTDGVRLSESAVLHVGITAEAGYDDNVFYNDANRVDSAVLRVTPSFELSNNGREGASGAEPASVSYRLFGLLQYREYLKSDNDVQAQRAFIPTVGASLGLAPSSHFSFTLADQFIRSEEPPYVKTDTTIVTDFNQGTVALRLAPGGGRLQTVLRYTNSLYFFEDTGAQTYKYADYLAHDISLDESWRWLPKTAVFLLGGVGYVQYLNPDSAAAAHRHNSVPLRILGGIRGLVTPKISATISAGYSTAFYDDGGQDPSGLSNVLVNVGLTYHVFTFTNLGLSYVHEFRNSPVVGDFYDLDGISASLQQQLGRFQLTAYGRYDYRRYKGGDFDTATADRRDNIFVGSVQADFFIQRWFYAGVGYTDVFGHSTFGVNATAAARTAAPDYNKQVILGRLGLIF